MLRARARARLAALTCALAVALVTQVVPGPAATAQEPNPLPAGLSRLLAEGTPSGRAIATFDSVPLASEVAALQELGVTVQPMKRLPLALVEGPVTALTSAFTDGIVEDVYPDERIELLDTASTNAMGSAALRAKGLTGKGVTVAVVDSGCDATHPDLADRVRHNVTLVSSEYANVPPDSSTTLVVPEDQGPYSNSDLGSGHGTHVAGIIGADSSSVEDGSRYGVAPDATIDCFAIGAVLFTTAVVTAYDYMLDQKNLWGIDVVNNSWGNSYRQFDPNDPVAVATKAVADKGVTVVFAAGNSGSEEVEMSLNPFSQSPWVISVAAAGVDGVRGGFSSNGLVHDNSRAGAIADDGHTTYVGDRIGLVHPDVAAPGVDISSTCASTGTLIGPCGEGENASASGTSMASPHVAGAAAVLLQAQPRLSPTQVRQALQASAVPTKRETGKGKAPFWQVGYGFVDLDAAVELVRSKGWEKKLAASSRAADLRVRKADGTDVLRGDFWTYAAPPLALGGSDTQIYPLPVGKKTDALKVTLAHPSLGTLGANLTSYTVTVLDSAGTEVGTTTESATAGSGTATATVDLRELEAAPGDYTLEVVGNYAASDPDTVDSDSLMGRFVTLHVAQLDR